ELLTKWQVEVVAVELEGTALVLPPLPTQSGEGYLRIPIIEAYTRYDRNGQGSREQRVTSGFTWDFSVQERRTYEIQVEVFRPENETPVEIIFNGRKSRHTVNSGAAERDIVLVSLGSFSLSPGKAYSLTVQAPGYVPGTPVGLSMAGLRIRE
ncbi:MAG: hypothetical protein ABIJ42_02030, partial [Acidobacteriota bacterium]